MTAAGAAGRRLDAAGDAGGDICSAPEDFGRMHHLVIRLPLTELWDDAGPVAASRRRDLTAADIRELLQRGPVRFVVADVAAPLRWVPAGDCFRFWKAEVQSRVADPGGASLDESPSGYGYFASEWGPTEGPPVVVLAVAH